MMKLRIAFAVALIAGSAWGCTGVHSGARPDDASAREHRRRAAEHERQAGAHRSQFDPDARGSAQLQIGFPVVPHINSDSVDLGQVQQRGDADYNPTGGHLDEARADHEHASEHFRAAAELEAFTNAACNGVRPKAREASPLIGKVIGIQSVPKGVRLLLAPGMTASLLMSAIRCHQAFAREHHFEGAPNCPLYLRHVDAVFEPDGNAVRLVTIGDDAIQRLRARSRHLVAADE
jgi:hypothetical protein